MISTEVRRYRLSPAGLTLERRWLWTRFFVIVVACWSCLGLFTAHTLSQGGDPSRVRNAWIVNVAVFAAIGIWGQRKLSAVWDSYELEIGPDYILRRQRGLSDLRLDFQQIKAIKRIPGRHLKIVGDEWLHSNEILESLEDFSEVLETLSAIRTPECHRFAQSYKLMVLGIMAVAGYGFMLAMRSPGFVIPLSLALYCLFMWAFLAIRRNPNWSTGPRFLAWAFLGFAVFCVVKFGQALRDFFWP